ncbi:protein-methionine-sulfoxide reductase heme-binding subunit MsrQ [Achromobacter dolens]|uniref:protein-methionine-sulfoxide reductase heme-binding subunit MsrQ n=2 Tax=Achromobacter dolens TaxID=1287738 RepID=UPI0014687BC0|nr:protein-methionine-sulfoxide reductase heme-binding subunit MsrQ [Achromobacter dolens]CAB3649997.1 Protein-methionine-sulfoxide reductase heme-binding subunit MsrQ [Achromobacter dolens]
MKPPVAESAGAAPARKPQWSARAVGRVKPWLFLLGLAPFARWLWLGFTNGLTANPVEFLTRSSGTWTLVCLLVTLAITPLRRLTGQPALVRLRRMCGLFAFFYGAMHFMAWVWWDRGFDPAAMLQDIGERPFITVGFAAFVLMTALAATSTQWAMRKMGRRWQQLHRAIYLIGLLAVLHYWWHKAGKNDLSEPILYASVLALLLGWRLAAWWRRRGA